MVVFIVYCVSNSLPCWQDPMLATGGSAGMAIQKLLDEGVAEEHIVFANIVACPEGLELMAAK
jgi:uracil phosphoribosyltransferase